MYHRSKVVLRLRVTSAFVRLTFALGARVNCRSICFSVRDVAYPVTSSVKPLADRAPSCSEISRGAADAMESDRLAGESGVRLYPVCVANEGVMVMLPATEPVCSLIVVAPLLNTAWVLLAGIVKETVRPPVENCTEGSVAKVSELTDMVSVPANGSA